jgi:hypothetical protein
MLDFILLRVLPILYVILIFILLINSIKNRFFTEKIFLNTLFGLSIACFTFFYVRKSYDGSLKCSPSYVYQFADSSKAIVYNDLYINNLLPPYRLLTIGTVTAIDSIDFISNRDRVLVAEKKKYILRSGYNRDTSSPFYSNFVKNGNFDEDYSFDQEDFMATANTRKRSRYFIYVLTFFFVILALIPIFAIRKKKT